MIAYAGYIDFMDTRIIVVDEADTFITMRSLVTTQQILEYPTPGQHQTLLLSATLPEYTEMLVGRYLRGDYVNIFIGWKGKNLGQEFHLTNDDDEKLTKLFELFEGETNPSGTLIFVATPTMVENIANALKRFNYPTAIMHDRLDQIQRELSIRRFVTNDVEVMVATSLAGRGLDMHNVTHVINFDLPMEIHEYIHRIGRTGRIGNIGRATTFFNPEYVSSTLYRCTYTSIDSGFCCLQDAPIVDDLVRFLEDGGTTVPDFLTLIKAH